NELIRHLSFVDDTNGWAVGHRGSIFHTADGGLTWETQLQDKGNYLRDIAFADKNNGWAVGHGSTIWHTADGGKIWTKQTLTGFEGRDLPRLHGVVAKDANNAILVGEFGTIAYTENGGELWLVAYNASSGTLLSIANQGAGAIAVGLDGGVYAITVETEAQKALIEEIRANKLAKAEEKARKKAKRRGKEYVPKEVVELPETEIGYFVTQIDSGISNHLYDVSSTTSGQAIAVGASAVLKISKSEVVSTIAQETQDPIFSVKTLTSAETFPLPFVWIGGVDVTESGDIWAAGLRGMIVKGGLESMTFGEKLNIAASENVKLISSRWGDK
ncbi:MAG: YCF48-related protein, partial [Cycloclasticus pugetii]